MDAKKEDFMPEKDFSELTEEEKREYARNLIHSSKAANVIAAFFDPHSGKKITIDEFVEMAGGEEEAIDKLVKILGSTHMHSVTLDNDDIKELIEKAERGEATDEELAILKQVVTDISFGDRQQFERATIDTILDIVNYSQNKIGYNPGLLDIIMPILVVSSISAICSDNEEVNKYKDAGSQALIQVCEQIGSDIYDTWKETCEEELDTNLVILSLLQLACRLSAEAGIQFTPAETIAKTLNVKIDNFDDKSENGFNDEDESAKDIIKSIFNNKPAENQTKPSKIIEMPNTNDEKIKKIKNFYKN